MNPEEDSKPVNIVVPDGSNDFTTSTALELRGKPIDLKQLVKDIAEDAGIDAEKAAVVAERISKEKYYDEPLYYQPFSGATTFSEIDTSVEAVEYGYKVDEVTSQLRGLVHNITCNPEMDSGAKAKAITDAAGEYRNRLNSVDSKDKTKTGIFNRVVEDIKSLLHWPEDKSELEANDIKEHLPQPGGFKVYKDKETNKLRWVSLSSNAFEDREKELFTTEALQEAVEYADKTDQRGPLLVFHVPSAEIGQCDFQAVVGRFLLESGTFDDTPIGSKAAEYYVNSGEEQQVSIGYTYRDGDEEDGVYDWLRYRERSVCPSGTAANPWTKFETVGGKVMEERKMAELKKVFGEETAAGLISLAEEKTKELEERVRFKEMKEDEEDDDEDKKKKVEKKTGEETTSLTGEQGVQLANLIVEMATSVDTLTEAVSGLKTKLESLNQDVKQLKKTDDEKVADIVKPRLDITKVARPTEDEKNLVDGKDINDIKQDEDGKITNPAQQLAQDLLTGRVPAAVN